MTRIVNPPGTWSAGTAITKDEFWQVSLGIAYFTSDSSPGDDDGVFVPAPYGIEFRAGVTVKYRSDPSQPCVITRTATST
jgi:hypothetical protein